MNTVCAVGADYAPVRDAAQEILKQYGYEANVFCVSDLITAFSERGLPNSPEFDRISSRMDAGNDGCKESGRNDLWALAAIAQLGGISHQSDQCSQEKSSKTRILIQLLLAEAFKKTLLP